MRGAPEEFRLLVTEVNGLSSSLRILTEEVQNPDSTLRRSGEDRIRTMNEMLSGIRETLQKLEKRLDKHKVLSLNSGSKPRQIWSKFKWSTEAAGLDSLRSKIMYHNMIVNLILNSAGNSSLQRIETATKTLESDVRAIKDYVSSNVAGNIPILSQSAIEDEDFRLTLSARFLESSEKLDRWTAIGIEQWIGCGHWWLTKVVFFVVVYQPSMQEQY